MEVIEVYKTDVNDESKAAKILDEIRRTFPGSDPSIDLQDCDKVLRIESPVTGINEARVQQILSNHGYEMEILP